MNSKCLVIVLSQNRQYFVKVAKMFGIPANTMALYYDFKTCAHDSWDGNIKRLTIYQMKIIVFSTKKR